MPDDPGISPPLPLGHLGESVERARSHRVQPPPHDPGQTKLSTDSGSAAIEYGLIAGTMATMLLLSLGTLGDALHERYESVIRSFETAR